MAYDVGKIVRDLQTRFKLFKRGSLRPIDTRDETIALELQDNADGTYNLATPENVGALVTQLETFTRTLAALRESSADEDSLFLPNVDRGQWDLDFVRWRGRLGAYRDAIDKAPPGDRKDILWSVTAPLLLGFYGGEASKLPQQVVDLATPFMLANQLQVTDAWRDERWNLFLADLNKGIKAVGGAALGLAGLVVGGVVVIGGAILLSRIFGR